MSREAAKTSLGHKMKDNAWFVAFAPLESPQLAVAVLVEHGGHGGEAAAPIARKIFETHFHLAPRGKGSTLIQPQPESEPLVEEKNLD